ncbi:hypothetical protein OV079_39745 [Nannocystis pusilla]|uniref:Uncharacterized protein n=1 Tax=Nannocystis pusilla TaxID=889268 RepID=A0A9X3EWW7_9BACT|nr:hypothetical protein [Nannocystis pusilla]MCY1011596.1 hypothetical protein [Nannocystis pusilla]
MQLQHRPRARRVGVDGLAEEEHAGVVDEDVDPQPAGVDGGDQPLGGALHGEVLDDRVDLDRVRGGQLGGRARERLLAVADEDQGMTASRQAVRDRQADAGAGAGHQRGIDVHARSLAGGGSRW